MHTVKNRERRRRVAGSDQDTRKALMILRRVKRVVDLHEQYHGLSS